MAGQTSQNGEESQEPHGIEDTVLDVKRRIKKKIVFLKQTKPRISSSRVRIGTRKGRENSFTGPKDGDGLAKRLARRVADESSSATGRTRRRPQRRKRWREF